MIGERSRPGGWRFTDGTREFRLFPEQRRFFNDDEEVELAVRAYDLLVLLVKNAGHTVTKQEITETVWRTQHISDSTISTHMSMVRRAIGRDLIATINNQGYQFTQPVEPVEVPALAPRPIGPPPGLPHPAATSVGRQAELAQLKELVAQNRSVTIVGPGGIGKTWLAVTLGWRLADAFSDGVFLVDLGPVRDGTALASAVAQRLAVALRSGDNPVRIIGGSIDAMKVLLIFDGCEYAADAARAMVEGLLARCPNLVVLATSQAALRLAKEKVFRLQPLPQEDAVSLFVESVRALETFEPDAQASAAMGEICRRLDGMPLALEMAAAAVPIYGMSKVVAGLDRRFAMLDSAPRPGDERHSTLTAAMDWSHGLLDDAEKELFRRLAGFAGSFTAEAAEAVVWDDGPSEWRAPARLARLTDKSLLVTEPGEPRRYRMLETIRLYAAAKLHQSGEREMVAERHARYYRALFKAANEIWETMPDAEWAGLYAPEIDDARVALDWAMGDPSHLPLAASIGAAAAHLWERLDLPVEGRRYLDRLVELNSAATPSPDAAMLFQRASMLWRRTDRARAVALIEQSIALYRKIDDSLNLGVALGFAGGDYVFLGRYAEAKAALNEAQGLLDRTGHVKSSLRVTINLGTLAQREGRVDEALRQFNIARGLARSLSDKVREYVVLNNLAVLEFRTGGMVRAIEHFREAASGFRSISQRSYLGPALVNLAACLALQSSDAEARAHAEEALSLTRLDGGFWLRLCLECWAFLAAHGGQYAEAAQLLGFVEGGMGRSGEAREPLSQRIYDEASRLLAANCQPQDLRSWEEDGERWTELQAADFAARRVVASEK